MTEMKTIKLNNGVEMPVLGYGVFLVNSEECERCALDAIEVGYRLIDTAQAYYNEDGVGRAIEKCVYLRQRIVYYDQSVDFQCRRGEGLPKYR